MPRRETSKTWKSGSKPLGRLVRAMEASRDDLERARQLRRATVQQYLGAHCFEGAAEDRVPVNLIELEVSILTRLLMPERPRVLVTTKSRSLRPAAADFELAINEAFIELHFETIVRRAVSEGWFGMGIVKHGLCGEEHELVQSGELSAQQPFMDLVDLDDWVHDTTARDFDRISFAGDLTPLDWEFVQKSGLYEELDDLAPDDEEQTRPKGEETTRKVVQAPSSGRCSLRPTLSAWNIYVPRDQVVLTIPERIKTKIIRVTQWKGPRSGPYEYLRFGEAPGAAMSLPPAASAKDLHDLCNALFRKGWRQAERQRNLNLYEGGAEDDADRLRNAEDGAWVRVDDVTRTLARSINGADSQTVGMWLYAMNLHNRLRGNLDAVGGLAAQSETARQDVMLTKAAGQRISDMRARVLAFIRHVARAMAWYEWTEPLGERMLMKRVAGSRVAVPVLWAHETRQGRFIDFNFDICPYSLQSRDPTEQLGVLMQFVERLVLPLLPMLQAQGTSLDAAGLIRLAAKYASLPEVSEVLRAAVEEAGSEQAGAGEPGRAGRPTVPRSGNGQPNRDLQTAERLVGLAGAGSQRSQGSE